MTILVLLLPFPLHTLFVSYIMSSFIEHFINSPYSLFSTIKIFWRLRKRKITCFDLSRCLPLLFLFLHFLCSKFPSVLISLLSEELPFLIDQTSCQWRHLVFLHLWMSLFQPAFLKNFFAKHRITPFLCILKMLVTSFWLPWWQSVFHIFVSL